MTAFAEDPGESPGFLLWRVTLRWQRIITRELRPLGLTHVQFVLLASAWWLGLDKEPPNQMAIAQHADIDVKMTSQVLHKLESKGLITTQSDVHDRRARIVRVMPEGIRLAEQAVMVIEKVDAEFFSAAGPAAVPALRALAGF